MIIDLEEFNSKLIEVSVEVEVRENVIYLELQLSVYKTRVRVHTFPTGYTLLWSE